MEPDFKGWATKAGLKCSDGRTIMPNAFAHQDKLQVPLVWQHGHTDPENVLGHAILENRDDGVYAYGYFNPSQKAKHAQALLSHKDITHMSIWANQLVERDKRVLHGAIREVSLVLSGANPGAVIEHVRIQHSDGDVDELDDEAIIHTGLEFDEIHVEHAEGDETSNDDSEDDEETIADVYNTLTDKQKDVVHYMIGEAIDAGAETNESDDDEESDSEAKHSSESDEDDKSSDSNKIEHGNNETDQEGKKMNVFENQGDGSSNTKTLSHADIEGIVADAKKSGSLKDAVESYALSHGITDIEVLFPEAQALSGTPEFDTRRTEWVTSVLGDATKSPFARVKTVSADLTLDDARAKGYVKGDMKREEFFGVQKRVTTPTTIYKKQKLDRDDMIDITDFDVVGWLKGEMRLMLDEELARAILIGDGRDVAHEDKINEGNIRPIATDHELYTTVLNVNIDDANSSAQEIVDAIVANRKYYKGSGMPTFYTTETVISSFMLLKDTLGRRIYNNLGEVASELRVKEVVPVEVLEGDPTILGVVVNLTDYVIGADKGGNVSLFDDFDIDYNQYKYLIETRVSGALTKLKSAMVIKKVAGSSVLVAPAKPAFDGEDVTITNQTGVVYKDSEGTTLNAAGSPYSVAAGERLIVNATPAAGYYFATSAEDSWTFVNTHPEA